jgi:hypothetical protein
MLNSDISGAVVVPVSVAIALSSDLILGDGLYSFHTPFINALRYVHFTYPTYQHSRLYALYTLSGPVYQGSRLYTLYTLFIKARKWYTAFTLSTALQVPAGVPCNEIFQYWSNQFSVCTIYLSHHCAGPIAAKCHKFFAMISLLKQLSNVNISYGNKVSTTIDLNIALYALLLFSNLERQTFRKTGSFFDQQSFM